MAYIPIDYIALYLLTDYHIHKVSKNGLLTLHGYLRWILYTPQIVAYLYPEQISIGKSGKTNLSKQFMLINMRKQ